MANRKRHRTRVPLWLLLTAICLGVAFVRMSISGSAIGDSLFAGGTQQGNPAAATPDKATIGQKGRLSDGSGIVLKAVSFGTFHWIPSIDKVPYFRTAVPTIMFTYRRYAAVGVLKEEFCCAYYVDNYGSAYPLRRRSQRRAANDGYSDVFSIEGSPPRETQETWEFPAPPPAGMPIRVWIYPSNLMADCPSRSATKLQSFWRVSPPHQAPDDYVEFTLPNSVEWRARSVLKLAQGFNLQEWLDQEIIHAGTDWYAQQLIVEGANINAVDDEGRTALSYVCEDDSLEPMKNLLLLGADVNAGNIKPLMVAAENGEERAVRFLLARGADPNARVQKGERAGWDAAMFAASECYHNIVDVLIARGAKTSTHNIRRVVAEACARSKYH